MTSFIVELTSEQMALLFVLVVKEWQRPLGFNSTALARARQEVALELVDLLASYLWAGGSPKAGPVS